MAVLLCALLFVVASMASSVAGGQQAEKKEGGSLPQNQLDAMLLKIGTPHEGTIVTSRQ